MTRFFKTIGSLLLIVLAAFMIGPRPDTSETVTFSPDSLGDDLDKHLFESEAKIPNLIEGAEKEIIWHNSVTKEKTKLAIVYVHGFSATKHEIRPVPDNVAKALGANLYYVRLTGHGRNGAGLAEAKTTDWTNDLAEAIAIGERIGEKTILMSTSTGSTLATWGLNKPEFSKNVVGSVMVSPNFELQGISTWLANIPWAETILPLVGGENRSWEPQNELHGKWWTNSYPSRAIFPMTSIMKIIKSIDKSTIKTPALFIYSPNDRVIVPSEVEKVALQWGGDKQIEQVTSTKDPFAHVIAGDIMSPENTEPVTKLIVDWAKTLNR